MRLARLSTGDEVVAVAERDNGSWVPLRALGLPEDTVSCGVAADVERTLAAAAAEELDRVSVTAPPEALRHPLTHVGKIICIGLNYRDHIAEIGATPPAVPLVFAKFPSALNDPRAAIPVPGAESQQLDFEAELVVVIGREGAWIQPADVHRFVSGYAVANDVSTRDIQFAEGQWTRSKSFDGFCPLGPWITTADAVPTPGRLRISTTVNGETRQDSSTAELLYGIDELVSFVSRGVTLAPGDIILTGTPPGVAMGEKEPRWLASGDVVRCEIEGLGYVENTITATLPDPLPVAAPA
jgi:2-keto-4-pentenoate hydratase/2-oxohepta-3-ene-1,7-dioic acid hydratase in catechol pathway